MAIGAKDYWFPWYPQRYQNATRKLSNLADLAYRRLIDEYMMSREPFPDDDEVLARVSGMSLAEWLSVSHEVRPFFKVRNGMLRNARCDASIMLTFSKHQKFVERASKAARVRWNKTKSLDASSNAKPMLQAMLGDARGEKRRVEKNPPLTPPCSEHEEKEIGYVNGSKADAIASRVAFAPQARPREKPNPEPRSIASIIKPQSRTMTPENRKAAWEQSVIAELVRTRSSEEAQRIINAYMDGTPDGIKIFNSVGARLKQRRKGGKHETASLSDEA